MKKTTWLLLALSLVAMLLVAGCQPTTPAPTESPAPTATVAPTPTPDAAPKVVKTTVSKAEGWGDGAFKITIVFDEDIYSPCAENPDNWEIRVVNSQRREGNRNILIPVGDIVGPQIVGNQIILYAWVEEFGAPVFTYALVDCTWDALPTTLSAAISEAQNIVSAVNALSDAEKIAFLMTHNKTGGYDALLLALNAAKIARDTATPDDDADALADLPRKLHALGLRAVRTVEPGPTFAGLICNKEDADAYKEVFGIEVTAADVVHWSLNDDCVISDILGNGQCGYSDKACCVGPECEECEECDLTTGICK